MIKKLIKKRYVIEYKFLFLNFRKGECWRKLWEAQRSHVAQSTMCSMWVGVWPHKANPPITPICSIDTWSAPKQRKLGILVFYIQHFLPIKGNSFLNNKKKDNFIQGED